ncbi:RING-type E3 ubiquitin transferase [Ranunculus cassubicifolius]
MLQIRLNTKGSASEGTGGGGGGKPSAVTGGETVTVACPDHLVLADLPVAKSIGTATTCSLVKIVGRRSRRHLGERLHFCVRCDFPIAIYGRLSPCEHAFCLDCARSDSSCYLCDERIQKIQTIKMMEGIFICAAPHCLKSFLKKSEFETHIHQRHADLLQHNTDKEEPNNNEADTGISRQASTDTHAKQQQSSTADISTARTQPRPPVSAISQPPTPRTPTIPPFFGRPPNFRPESGTNRFQNFGPQDLSQQVYQPQPNFVVPMNMNMNPPVYVVPSFSTEGGQQFYEAGQDQGSLLGFPPAPTGGGSTFSGPWNMGGGMTYEQMQVSQGITESYGNNQSSYFQQGEYGRVPPGSIAIPLNPLMPPMMVSGSDNKKGVMTPRPPMPSSVQFAQFQGQSYGWQHDGYAGSSQE